MKTVRKLLRMLAHPTNRGRRLRTLGRVVLVHARGRILDRPTAVPLGERSRILAHPSAGSSMRAVYANPPDAAEFAVWRAWLRPGDLFFDAGANVGLYSLMASEMGARVVAIEPDAAGLDRLRANVELNRYDVEIVPSAVGATTGTIRFSEGEDVYGHVVDDGGVEVAVTTLDSLLGDRHAAGVKIDVEGFERPVVEGLENALRESRVGLLQLEWNAASERRQGEGRGPLLELLADHGYELFAPTPTGGLTPLTGNPPGANVFAARPDAVQALVPNTSP